MSASLERKLDEAVGRGDLRAPFSPYLPALEQLVQLVKLADPYLSPYATTNVLFLSDGKPSDAVHALELPRRLATVLHELRAAVPEWPPRAQHLRLRRHRERRRHVLGASAR